MFNKKTIAAFAGLAAAQQAVASSVHRNLHVEARNQVVHTHYVTHVVTITAGAEGAQPPAPTPQEQEVDEVVYEEPAPPAPEPPQEAPKEVPEVVEEEVEHRPQQDESNNDNDNNDSDSGNNDNNDSGNTSKPKGDVKKRGLAYEWDGAALCDAFSSSDKLGWVWNWGSSPGGYSGDLEFVPTMWGPDADHEPHWDEDAKKAIENGATAFMSFNECDNGGQCNLGADAAAEAHVRLMNPYADDVRIGSPSVSNSNLDGEGLDWLQAWVDACKSHGCAYDFVNVHWYHTQESSADLFEHVKKASEICDGKPVWVTEFAPLGSGNHGHASPSEAADWLPDVLDDLDDDDLVERYSYFLVQDGVLNSGNGLSVAGEVYANH